MSTFRGTSENSAGLYCTVPVEAMRAFVDNSDARAVVARRLFVILSAPPCAKRGDRLAGVHAEWLKEYTRKSAPGTVPGEYFTTSLTISAAAELLGVHKTTAARAFEYLVKWDVLTCIHPHKQHTPPLYAFTSRATGGA